ncbi:MAG: hypothetical protein MUP30_14265 [Deltaproteobacteria bacterium]|nr:hypothetical protein [Deltaproteobacteria bacterium]
MIKKLCRQQRTEFEKEVQSKYKYYETLFGKIPSKGIDKKIEEVDFLINHIDNRIHYTETRITRTVTFSVTLIGIGMAFFAAIINLKEFSLYLGLITSGSMILTGLIATLIHIFQVNPNYPFKALPNDWKWFYPRIVDNEYKPKAFVYEQEKAYFKKRLLHINGLNKYAQKVIDETPRERLKIDIQQLYLLHVNEKYKNYFLTTLRKVLNVGLTVVLISLIILLLNVSIEKIKPQKKELPKNEQMFGSYIERLNTMVNAPMKEFGKGRTAIQAKLGAPSSVTTEQIINRHDPKQIDLIHTLSYRGLVIRIYDVVALGRELLASVRMTDNRPDILPELIGKNERDIRVMFGDPDIKKGTLFKYAPIYHDEPGGDVVRIEFRNSVVVAVQWDFYLD